VHAAPAVSAVLFAAVLDVQTTTEFLTD
jgi:hypothetical protein